MKLLRWFRGLFDGWGDTPVHHEFPRMLLRRTDACKLCGTTIEEIWHDTRKVDCPAKMNCGGSSHPS